MLYLWQEKHDIYWLYSNTKISRRTNRYNKIYIRSTSLSKHSTETESNGRVIVGFVLKNGTISHVNVIKMMNPDLDAETTRIGNNMRNRSLATYIDRDSIRGSFKLSIKL